MLCSRTSYSKPNSSYNSYAQSSTLPPFDTASPNPPKAPHLATNSTGNAPPPPSHLPTHHTWGVSPYNSSGGTTPNENSYSAPSSELVMDDKGKGKEDEPSRSSPSASSSQDDMADTELEAGSSQPTEQGGGAPPPPKKKRTRTLTTPHQSAVLHALLAQSRFPTTAMREEVGRSIGLSARKVQIWFQNQRQKARRPRGHNVPPLTRPPQFGPFPNVPSGSTMGTAPTMGAQVEGSGVGSGVHPSNFRSDTDQRAPFSTHSSAPSSASLSPEYYSRAEAPYTSRFGRPLGGGAPQLSGPGIPGPSRESVIIDPAPRGRSIGPRPRRGSVRSTTRFRDPYPRASTPGETLEAHRLSPRPARSLPPAGMPFQDEDDFPITLPPLLFSRSPSPETHREPGPSTSSRRRVRSPLASSRVLGRSGMHPQSFADADSPFAHQIPVNLPPPFTLQPSPLWDDPAFSPFNPPGTSSRPGSSYHSSSSHNLSRSQTHLPSPTHYSQQYSPGSTTTTSPTALPSFTNLFHEGVASPHTDVTLAPIRTRSDVVRQAVSPQETNLPLLSLTLHLPREGAPAAQPGPSHFRDDDEDPENRQDVHQPSR